VRESAAAFTEVKVPQSFRRADTRTASTLATLLDTRVVRAELLRLRGPRPGTPLAVQFDVRSSPPTAGDLDRV